MIVAVLGANGQLGSDLVSAASATGGKVRVLPLTRKDLDVTDLAAIPIALAGLNFDALVNCTSYHKTDEVEGRATEAFRINAHAVVALAKACRARGARFVQISTDYVFDGKAGRPYSETDPANPVNVYGASKLLGETLAQREYPEGTFIVRVASLFGAAGASGKGGNFVETILRKAKETGEVRVVNDITMSPTYTTDAGRVILQLPQESVPAGIYHIVNTGSATWFEFAERIVAEVGVRARMVPTTSAECPGEAHRPPNSALRNDKVSHIVGGIRDWESALRSYLKTKGHFQMARSLG